MTCPRCIPMCATTEAQHANRQRNMGQVPDATPFPCPGCGSMDWATTREQIREEKQVPWWHAGHPRIFHKLRLANIGVASLCIGMAAGDIAIYGGPTYAAMCQTFMVGFNIACAISCSQTIRSNANFRRLRGAFDELHQLNQALIENRVQMHIAGMSDDEPPLAPRLH